MAMSATSSNLIVYLIRKYNVKSIDAAQISNIVRGCVQLAPVLGAAASDAYFGCYPVVAAGAAISLLSFVVFTLTAAFPSLPAVLYTAVCLLAVGNGGTRYNAATLGADQFAGGGERGRDAFFSWYFACLYASYVAGDTALVYLQDSVSWALGFGVCAATTALGLVALLAGSRPSPWTAPSALAASPSRLPPSPSPCWPPSSSPPRSSTASPPRCGGGSSLQRVGIGHALNVASMVVAALVERRRIRVAHAHAHGAAAAGDAVPMSAAWLVAQLALTGAEEALHLPGNTALFYREFPGALRSTATAMPPLSIAVGSYLSTAFVGAVRRATGWLPDDLNRSQLDRVYWTLALLAAANLCYFLVCAITYRYTGNDVDGDGEASHTLDDK
ncbi:unnamed protein product [Urochloa decumbens]|uniref:Uncharacterized protein n=1 Tax=Urochloa decumbens TaxID=240449 RepID=A0ABC9H0H2_9POAL